MSAIHMGTMCGVLVALLFLCLPVAAAAQKVILDTDMVEGFDDGVAMVMLANAPEMELLGVTTVAGNTWASEGAAFALRQLELIGRNDVPVCEGLSLPLRPGRVESIAFERNLFGTGADQWVGALDRPAPLDWHAFYRSHYREEPRLGPDSRHGVDFIIDTVRAHPGEVIIAAIGPCGNLAMAVRKAPDIVPLIKRVVYMGGAFFQPGNVTPAAEFNWWFDPEAAHIAVRTPFREQVVVGLDVCEKSVFNRDDYHKLMAVLGDSRMAALLRGTFVGQCFESNPDFTHFIWDVVAAAIIIDPTLVTGQVRQPVDVVTDYGPAYGQSLAYVGQSPAGTREAVIITDIDQTRFWQMLLDSRYWREQPEESR